MTTTFYSSVTTLKTKTGVKPKDLGFEGDEAQDEFDAFLEEMLESITDQLDRKMRRSFLDAEDGVPKGLADIASDAAANSLREMVATRQEPIVRIDDFAVRVIRASVFTPDIKERLKLYSKGQGVASIELGQDSIRGLPSPS